MEASQVGIEISFRNYSAQMTSTVKKNPKVSRLFSIIRWRARRSLYGISSQDWWSSDHRVSNHVQFFFGEKRKML
jgi:hypothetical protein